MHALSLVSATVMTVRCTSYFGTRRLINNYAQIVIIPPCLSQVRSCCRILRSSHLKLPVKWWWWCVGLNIIPFMIVNMCFCVFACWFQFLCMRTPRSTPLLFLNRRPCLCWWGKWRGFRVTSTPVTLMSHSSGKSSSPQSVWCSSRALFPVQLKWTWMSFF